MQIGVLLLTCKGSPRRTTFTAAQVERVMAEVTAFYSAQSGGRVNLTWTVRDWQEAPFTSAEWHAKGMGATQAVADELGFTLPYDHVVTVIDEPDSSGGTTPGSITHIAAVDFGPAGLCHELGHRFGAEDAWGPVNGELERYRDPWCAMGWLGHTYHVPGLDDPGAPDLHRAGPGMSVPTLIETGWLDPKASHVLVDLSKSGSVHQAGGVVVELSALTGAVSGPTARGPVGVRVGGVLVEYRTRSGAGADKGLPDPGHWIVAHTDPTGDTPVSAELVAAFPATVGTLRSFGEDDVFDLFHDGPLQVFVMSLDEAKGTVRLAFSRRRARPLEQEGLGSGDGVMVFIPGVGFKPIPPHSPLVGIVEKVAAVHALHEAQLVATDDERPALERLTRKALDTLTERSRALPTGSVPSPLEEALEYVTELRRDDSLVDRARLATVEGVLAEAVRSAAQR
ncbi:hypothetical protein [Streptomyces sp. NPDC002490]|uniref:hypothetical protein n=1 Tax=Streptomyces sp. NPDC002490 TaxID=3154416 RepID=UPI00333036B8